MMAKWWGVLKSAFAGYFEDNALSRGAAIAYYTITSIAPVLVIVIAIAGLVFGADAARGAIVDQIGGMMGKQGAEAIQSMIQGASNRKSGIIATILGVAALLATASGVFGEMQSALNAIWKAEPQSGTVSRMVRARLASLGLVAALGFLLLVSLVISTLLSALGLFVHDLLPGVEFLMRALSFVVSYLMISALFACIYKVLPDKTIEWRDVIVGALATGALFTIGKFGISEYIGSSAIASSYGAASALIVILVWIYYSSQIFLFGAEFTRAYAETHGSHAAAAVPDKVETGPMSHKQEIEHLKRTLNSTR